MKKLLLLAFTVFALLVQGVARAELVLVAAASDLNHCIDELGAAYQKLMPGAQLKVTLGSSGNFYAQIRNGAPYDVFMSADLAYPARLADGGAADGATLSTYAIGRVALWTLDPRFDLRQGLRVLNDARLTRLAIANPELAPYGRAAREALQQLGYWDAVKDKLVVGENIAQAAQFVQSGNAELGLVSYATVLAPAQKGKGSYYLLPESGAAPIEQGAVLTRHGHANQAAAHFLAFLHSPMAREILLRHGFGLPHEKNGA